MDFTQTYNDLMNALSEHPETCAEIEEHLTELFSHKRNLESLINESEADIISAAGGYSALGKNDVERKAQLFNLLRINANHKSMTASLVAIENQIAEAQAELDSTKRRYSAATYKAQLTAGYMMHLGRAYTMPVSQEVEFGI